MKVALGLLAVFLSVGAASAAPPALTPVATPYVSGDFAGEDNQASVDLSGVACRPAARRARFCVFVDDEATFIQPAVLRDNVLTVVKPVPVLPDKRPVKADGEPPSPVHCPGGEAGFKDLDGEAVALAPSRVYVTGSHGCGRKSEKFRASGFIVARLHIDARNKMRDVQRTYRLSEVLRAQPRLDPYFTQSLMSANGLTLEGMAVRGRDLLFGLRAPTIDGKAFIVSVPADTLFSENKLLESQLIEIPLGAGVGIRDLAALPDGRLLVLAGPAQDQATPFSIVLLDPSGVVTRRAELAEVAGPEGPAKAEGMAVLEQTADSLRLLIVFDGVKNGAPREYSFPLQ